MSFQDVNVIQLFRVGSASEIHYKILVYTGHKPKAGTDAKVYITLVGDLGESEEILLDQHGKNLFERGSYVLSCDT